MYTHVKHFHLKQVICQARPGLYILLHFKTRSMPCPLEGYRGVEAEGDPREARWITNAHFELW